MMPAWPMMASEFAVPELKAFLGPCFVWGGKLCPETEFVFAGNLFNIGSLWEFHYPIVYRIIMPLNKPIKK